MNTPRHDVPLDSRGGPSNQGDTALSVELTEFLEEQRDLERMHARGTLSLQEFSLAKQDSLLGWLFISNPDLFRAKPGLRM